MNKIQTERKSENLIIIYKLFFPNAISKELIDLTIYTNDNFIYFFIFINFLQ